MKTLVKSRNVAYVRQQGRCFYCSCPMPMSNNLEAFAQATGLSLSLSRQIVCTAEHLKAKSEGGRDRRFEPDGTGGWRVTDAEGKTEFAHFVADRDKAVANESLSLLGLDHPMMESYLGRYASLPAEFIGISTKAVDGRQGVLSLWRVISTDEKHRQKSLIVPLAIDADQKRCPSMERLLDRFFESEPASPNQERIVAESALSDAIEPMLHRELVHRGVAKPGQAYESSLIGWIECV